MCTTQQLSASLPTEMALAGKETVRTGEYASESDVIREGLRALPGRDRAVEGWRREHVVPAYQVLKSRSIPRPNRGPDPRHLSCQACRDDEGATRTDLLPHCQHLTG